MTKTEEIWADAYRLCQKYAPLDLAHNARGIFDLAYDACNVLILRHNCPQALQMSQAIVDHYASLFMAESGKAS